MKKYFLLFLILIILIFFLKNKQETFLNFDQGTVKTLPLYNNSRIIQDKLDQGVLFNLRQNKGLHSYSRELTYYEMNTILDTLLGENYHNLNLNHSIGDNYEKIANKIVKLINDIYYNLDMNNNFHKDDTREYELLEYEILTDFEYEDIDKFSRRLVTNIGFYKKQKQYSFTVQIDVVYNPVKKYIDIHQAKIVGLKMMDKLKFETNWDQKYCNLENYDEYIKNPGSYNTKLQQCHKEQLATEDELRRFFNLNEAKLINAEKEFLNNKEIEKKKEADYRKYKCFINEGFNESICRSFSGETNSVGVWDKPCEKNTDCPFYKKNKNYPNERGKCNNGYCEMPTNIKRIGFKEYDKNIPPFCYNCNRKNCKGEECYNCCDEQKNIKKYPNLKSPDYIFNNDSYERSRYS